MNKNFLFLNFATSDDEMEDVFKIDRFPQIQNHKFNWNLIKALESTNEIDITYISAKPVSDFPYYNKKKIKGKIIKHKIIDKNIEIREIPYYNTPILKIITRFISGLFYSIKDYHKIKNKGGVIVYSVHLPFMIIGYLISKIYKIPCIGIWTDPPSISHSRESKLKSMFRKIELIASKILMKKMNKVIALTKYLAEDFAPKKPYIVIEGIIDRKEIVESIEKKTNNVKKILYAGSLEKRYGVKNIVEAFRILEEKNIELNIYGRGDYEKELMEICKLDSRIIYKGFISNKEILKALKKADLLINARSSEDEYVKYSFPSKTLEYMLSGTPLMTTMLPGIPKEYEKYIIKLIDNKKETIYKKINEYFELSDKEKLNIGVEAMKFTLKKNYINQGKQIINFIKRYDEI